MKHKSFILYISAIVCLSFFFLGLWTSCRGYNSHSFTTYSGLCPADFDTIIDGKKVKLYTLRNHTGMEVCITNYGARIVSIAVPDTTNKKWIDVALGFQTIHDYVNKPNCFGACVGRYANRIRNGRFPLLGDTIQLEINEHDNTCHGGTSPWHNQVFEAEWLDAENLAMKLHSPDGAGGFPGNVDLTLVYTISHDKNSFVIGAQAKTDKPTVINLTNHTFFNLSGDPTLPIDDHLFYVNADSILEIDDESVATGVKYPLKGWALDFRTPHRIGDALHDSTEYVSSRNGLDFTYLLDTRAKLERPAMQLKSPRTGLSMTVLTDEPSIHFYTLNLPDFRRVGKNGVVYRTHSGIAVEPGHYADAPNHPDWPSTTLLPGDTFSSTIIYSFSWR